MNAQRSEPRPARITTVRIAKGLVWFGDILLMYAAIILGLAFFLLLFNANPDAGFAEWVYRSADRVMEPFRGIFPTVQQGQGSVVDFSILFATIVYAIVAMIVHAVIGWLDVKIRQWSREAETARMRSVQTAQPPSASG